MTVVVKAPRAMDGRLAEGQGSPIRRSGQHARFSPPPAKRGAQGHPGGARSGASRQAQDVCTLPYPCAM